MNTHSKDPRTTFRRPKSWVIVGASLLFPIVFLVIWISAVGETVIGTELKQGIEQTYQEKYGDSNYDAYPSDDGQSAKVKTLDRCSASLNRISIPSLAAYPPMRNDIEILFAEADPYLTAWYQASEGGMPWRSNIYDGNTIGYWMTQNISKLYAASAINYAASDDWDLAFDELEQGRRFIEPHQVNGIIGNFIRMTALSIQVGVLEEMIRWNPPNEILLRINDQLDQIFEANQPIPVEIYLAETTSAYDHDDLKNDSITRRWINSNNLMRHQAMMQNHYLDYSSLGYEKTDRIDSLSWAAIPASLAQSTSIIQHHYRTAIEQIKLPDAVMSSVPEQEYFRLRRQVFVQQEMGNHDERRKFLQTTIVVQKMRIAAMMYYRKNGQWPQEFSQLSASIISQEEYDNKSGIFSKDEVFGPFHMKMVELIAENRKPRPAYGFNFNLMNEMVQGVESHYLGRNLLVEHDVNLSYSQFDQFAHGEIIISNVNSRKFVGNFQSADPILILAKGYLLRNHRHQFASNVKVDRLELIENTNDGGEIFTPSPQLWNKPIQIKNIPLTPEQAAADSIIYEEYKMSSCDPDIVPEITQERLQKNRYALTADISIPREAFVIYSNGPDGKDDGGTINYAYYSKSPIVSPDIATYLAEPLTGTE